jgi:hypothetical protein
VSERACVCVCGGGVVRSCVRARVFCKKFKNKYYHLYSKLVDILDRGRWPTIGTLFMSKTSNKKDRMEYILINRGSTITTSSLIHKTYQINANTEDKLMARWPKFTVNTMWFFIYLFLSLLWVVALVIWGFLGDKRSLFLHNKIWKVRDTYFQMKRVLFYFIHYERCFHVCMRAHTHTMHMFFDLAIIATKGQHITHPHHVLYLRIT